MITDEDRRTGRVQEVVRIFDFKGDSGAQPHDVFEAPSCRPLCDSAVSDCSEENRDDDAVEGADDEGEICDDDAGEESDCAADSS